MSFHRILQVKLLLFRFSAMCTSNETPYILLNEVQLLIYLIIFKSIYCDFSVLQDKGILWPWIDFLYFVL